jgi:spore germination protein GerM
MAYAAASALTPEEAAASDHTEAVLVLGWVERTTDGNRACSSDPAGLPPGEMGQMPVCSDDAPRVVPGPFAFLAGEQLQEETLYRTHGVHLMTSAQGRLRVVGVTPLLKEAHTAPPAPSSSPGSSSESTATGSGQTILVFFREQDGACTAVEPVERQVEETEAVATAALTELFKGPSDAERDRGLTSFFDEGTSGLLRSVHVDGGTAFLDLDAAFFDINNASTSCGSSMIKSSIEATLTQFSTVQDVRYAVEGEPSTFYHFMQMGCPTPRSDGDRCDPAPFSPDR